ncbi:MAG TPA: DUF1501 domain-containing protein [Acidobacteriaceae bacterium]|nr:DUF1501 domain-containing protein [Acidobacteriaceae bacterium]
MAITRRALMRNGAMALAGTTMVPGFLARAVFAAETSDARAKQRVVVLFQRGAADGLNIVVPHAEGYYYQARSSIAIPRDRVLDLDGFFGLHPALAPFKPLWDQKQLAIVHAAGSTDPSRSHFDAQGYMEAGTPGDMATQDGWLNRALQAEDKCPCSDHKHTPFRAVSMGADVALTLRGKVPAVAMSNVGSFSVGGRNPNAAFISELFESMYDHSTNSLLRGTGTETFEAIKMLKATDPAHYTPANGAQYPNGRFGDSMRQIAQLLKANLGVEAAFAAIGGWDHHVNEGNVNGQLAHSLGDLSQGIAAFWRDMGDEAENVTLVTMSEFGRTVRQNGTGGTDHGHGNVMFVLGGRVRGGKVYGQWPGLNPEQLYQNRDLAITTDYRRVLAEAVWKSLGAQDMNLVFPEAGVKRGSFLDYLPE